jgi:hypothetical protein
MAKLTDTLDEIGVGKALVGLVTLVLILLGTIWWDFKGDVAELEADVKEQLTELKALSSRMADQITATREEVIKTGTLVRVMTTRPYQGYGVLLPDTPATAQNGVPEALPAITSVPPQ